ncbi:hypothetical protein CCS77_1706 [Campylobacter concisus]|uniref:Uncharacterized protein n=1 Tax=Campylobacter concisus TaxID=199 RepID=A0A2R4P248_9BACT|nr:hypothetical protein CCS77_1706 [Campylobacter concisus]
MQKKSAFAKTMGYFLADKINFFTTLIIKLENNGLLLKEIT